MPSRNTEVEEERRLAAWERTQKSAFRNGTLRPDRVKALEALPFWEWGIPRAHPQRPAEPWGTRLDQLVAFHADHDRMPLKSEPLHHWVRNQKHRHQKGELSGERVTALERLPFWEWHIYGPQGRHFQVQLTKLREANGNHTPSMKAWANKQRRLHKNGNLPPECVASLEAVPGWSWQTDAERLTSERIQRQAEEVELVRRWYAENDYHPVREIGEVGMAVHRFRVNHENGCLTSEITAALEAIDGWEWRVRKKRQTPAQRLHEIRDWYANNDAHPTQKSTLGRWINAHRVKHKAGKIDPDLAAALEAIDGWEWRARKKR